MALAFALTIMIVFIIILIIISAIGVFEYFLEIDISILREQISYFFYSIKKLFIRVITVFTKHFIF